MYADDLALLSVSLSVVFLLTKLAGRHHAHKLAGASYDSWPVLAWFGVDLGLLAISLSISKKVDQVCRLTHSEVAILYVCLTVLLLASWISYGRFVKRYAGALGGERKKVWVDFFCCAWICLSLFCGFLGLGIVVRGLSQ